MALRDTARPLVKVEPPRAGERPVLVPLVPADPRVAFTPAYRPAGWRQSLLLQEQQRRLQRNK